MPDELDDFGFADLDGVDLSEDASGSDDEAVC